MPLRKQEARRVFFTFHLVTSLLSGAIFTVYALYFVTVAPLDALPLVLVGTALAVAVFEIGRASGRERV